MKKAARPKRGRPAANPTNPRKLRIEICIGERDKRQIDRRRGDETVSSWVYGLIQRELQRKG